ncbi:MAG: ATP-binding protein [Leptolyngbyaceae cyanobacterium bins.349]|nr:ATP-binding protein [Leptolyngbyaceae cyanobacterium bins.349]
MSISSPQVIDPAITTPYASMLALIEGQNQVLELIAQGKPLPMILDMLARLIESQASETTYCSFLLVDADGKRLRHGAAPSLPKAYCQRIDGIEIGPEVGSCGTAAHHIASVIVEDIRLDPLWAAFRELALSHGLQACWSTPILSCDGQVLATFAMYHPFPYKPVPHDRELLVKATYLARIAIERHQTEVALQQANDSLEHQVEQRTQELQSAIAQLEEQIQERQQAELQLRQKAEELATTLEELQKTQTRMIQSEKMSSLGQLVAGVAHEINNPVSFIYSNLEPARHYIDDLFSLLHQYAVHYPEPVPAVQRMIDQIDLRFLQEDLLKLLSSMQLGSERIKQIVLSLRTFSRMDEAESKVVDLHTNLDSTLTILDHRLKAQPNRPKIAIIKNYGALPLVQCYVGQLNQVFMNILVNAIDAIEDHWCGQPLDYAPEIRITTSLSQANQVHICIADNGVGIPTHLQSRLFDPFFTTKPVGRGTGMGLSISYQIVTERHQGTLSCTSQVGEGTVFTIAIPMQQPESD